jgi:hypothetical protein
LGNHAEDEFPQFFIDSLSSHAGSMPREPRPIQFEPRPVPANDGLRLNEDQRPFPPRPEPPQDHPEEFVESGKSRLRVLLLQNAELLVQSQVFQKQMMAGIDRSDEQDKQEPQRTKHEPVLAEAQENRAVSRVKLSKKFRRGFENCSRFCSCQSTKEQQGSTGMGKHTLYRSIKSSYFHPISPGFNKSFALFWDRWSHLLK